MEKTYRTLLAIGNDDLESEIRNLDLIEITDSDPDIEIITEILNYDTVDYVIVNTVLSEEKSIALAKKAKETGVRIIAMVNGFGNREFLAILAGFGVKAFVTFEQLQKVREYVKNYPEDFDFAALSDYTKGSRQRTTGIRGKIFNAGGRNARKKSDEPQSTAGRILGIIGASGGAGATSLCVGLATYLNRQGRTVLLLDRTDNQHLSKITIKGQIIDSQPLHNINLHKYNDIIIDFGHIAKVGAGGEVILDEDLRNEKKMERQFCSRIILVSSSLPWRLHEITAYIDHPIFEALTKGWIFYVNGEKNAVFENVRKEYEGKRDFLISYERENPYESLVELADKM